MSLFKMFRKDLICYSFIEKKYYIIYIDRIFSYSYEQVDVESVKQINEELVQISPYHYVNPKFVDFIFFKEKPETILANGVKLPITMNLNLLSARQNKFS